MGSPLAGACSSHSFLEGRGLPEPPTAPREVLGCPMPPAPETSDQRIWTEPDFQGQVKNVTCLQPLLLPPDRYTHISIGQMVLENGRQAYQGPEGSWVQDDRKLSLVLAPCLHLCSGFGTAGGNSKRPACTIVWPQLAWPETWLSKGLDRLDARVLGFKARPGRWGTGPPWCTTIKGDPWRQRWVSQHPGASTQPPWKAEH